MNDQVSDFFYEFREHLIHRLVSNCIIMSFLLTPLVTGPIISAIWIKLNPFFVLMLGTIFNFFVCYFFWLKSEIQSLKTRDVSRKAVSKLNHDLAKLDRKIDRLNKKIYFTEKKVEEYSEERKWDEEVLSLIQTEELVVAEVR
jgi:uncharacterized protein YlxW (UPF0749 family)